MAAHDEEIVTEPIQSLAAFLSLSSNTSAAQQFMAEYLQSILNCQDLRLDPFTTLCISQLQLNYDPTKGPSRITLFKLLSESNSMVSSSDIEIISNVTIDPAGDGDRYTQIMKRLGDKKLLIVAKTVTDFETNVKNMIAIDLFVLGNCFTHSGSLYMADTHRSEARYIPTLLRFGHPFLLPSTCLPSWTA